MGQIAILAYGSLRGEPGPEIGPLIQSRISSDTRFGIEYARLSSTRGGGPTVVPHSKGRPVSAELLLLEPLVSLDQARDMLWRRETRQEGSSRRYSGGSSPNCVLVKDHTGREEIAHILYTDFNDSGKLPNPDATSLAQAAIASVNQAPAGKDGISYLIDLLGQGVVTALTPAYQAEILRLTGANCLSKARDIAQRVN
jgi:hypothetical protein